MPTFCHDLVLYLKFFQTANSGLHWSWNSELLSACWGKSSPSKIRNTGSRSWDKITAISQQYYVEESLCAAWCTGGDTSGTFICTQFRMGKAHFYVSSSPWKIKRKERNKKKIIDKRIWEYSKFCVSCILILSARFCVVIRL